MQATNFVINQHENADLHTVADETSLEGPGSELSQDTRDLIDSSNLILVRFNTSPGRFGEREFDTRIKERPTKRDLDNINQTIADTSKVYASMRELLNKDKEDERPRYTTSVEYTKGERNV